MTVLVIIEHDANGIKPSIRNLIAAAQKVSDDIHGILIGAELTRLSEESELLSGIKKLIILDDAVYQAQLAENLSKVIAEYARNYTHVMAVSSTFGKDLMPRVSALLDTALLSDITEIIDENTFVRPIYAGNANCTVRSLAPIQFITIRASAFHKAKQIKLTFEIEKSHVIIPANKSAVLEQTFNALERPELTDADVVISGGRGLQSAENFKLLESFADKLNAAIGATRAAVDAGFVPNDYQVGQTGKIVAPELYIAIGISGAVQHLAGMKDSKVIVAINKDPDAPIFGVADYGLVGDLFEILPELEQALTQK